MQDINEMKEVGVKKARTFKEMRTQAGFTQESLAHAVGLSSGVVISRIETGSTKDPNLATVWSISKALEVPLEELAAVILGK